MRYFNGKLLTDINPLLVKLVKESKILLKLIIVILLI